MPNYSKFTSLNHIAKFHMLPIFFFLIILFLKELFFFFIGIEEERFICGRKARTSLAIIL